VYARVCLAVFLVSVAHTSPHSLPPPSVFRSLSNSYTHSSVSLHSRLSLCNPRATVFFIALSFTATHVLCACGIVQLGHAGHAPWFPRLYHPLHQYASPICLFDTQRIYTYNVCACMCVCVCVRKYFLLISTVTHTQQHTQTQAHVHTYKQA
jgi:hypothetical protein